MRIVRHKAALRGIGLSALLLLLCVPSAAVWCRDDSGHSAVETAFSSCCSEPPPALYDLPCNDTPPACGGGVCEDLVLSLTPQRGPRFELPPLTLGACFTLHPSSLQRPPSPAPTILASWVPAPPLLSPTASSFAPLRI